MVKPVLIAVWPGIPTVHGMGNAVPAIVTQPKGQFPKLLMHIAEFGGKANQGPNSVCLSEMAGIVMNFGGSKTGHPI